MKIPVVRQLEIALPGHLCTLFIELNLTDCEIELFQDGDRWRVSFSWDSLIQLLKEHGKKRV